VTVPGARADDARSTDEWPAGLNPAALRRDGWRPVPFRQFIVKIHGRCNLACDYCYVYEAADQSWRGRPVRMGRDVLDRFCQRVAEHAADHALDRVAVILHGGEPLLAGRDTLAYAADRLRAELPARTALELSVQTNGVLLDEAYLALLAEHDCRVGVSLDGTAADHDRHRRDAHGRGSAARVDAALRRLTAPRYRHLFAGLLCTIDLRHDPRATYQALLGYAPPMIDLLLPHATWASPPPPGTGAHPYGDWLVAAFDSWYDAPVRQTRVRLFEDIVQLLLGRPGHSESVGLSPYAAVVVDTDGSIEQVDSLKVAYDGAAGTDLHVDTDPFDAALRHPAVIARQIGVLALGGQCRACPVHRVCGGGAYPHRYRPGEGFRNPSVYCGDLYHLIDHVRHRVARDVGALRARPRRVAG
jgi:uncharacterized protein